jgi:hypothetical protein
VQGTCFLPFCDTNHFTAAKKKSIVDEPITMDEQQAATEAIHASAGTLTDFQFESLCKTVFRQADGDGNGFLDKDELMLVLGSPSLGLNMTKNDAELIAQEADQNSDGQIAYEEFIPILKELLGRVYSEKDSPHNEWASQLIPFRPNFFSPCQTHFRHRFRLDTVTLAQAGCRLQAF